MDDTLLPNNVQMEENREVVNHRLYRAPIEPNE